MNTQPIPRTITRSQFEMLPSYRLEFKKRLPSVEAVYFVFAAKDDKKTLVYVGMAKSVKARWQGHHKISEFICLKNFGFTISIAWWEFSQVPLVPGIKTLADVEKWFIKMFEPFLNNESLVNLRRHKTLSLTDEEIIHLILAQALED